MISLSWFWQLMSLAARDRNSERTPEPPVGDAGPAELTFGDDGWAVGARVEHIPSRKGWFYQKLRTADGWPTGVTHHFTAVDASEKTNRSMAIRRRDRERSSFLPGKPGSWHFSIADNGHIIQQLPLTAGAFHAGSPSARRLPFGWANFVCASIEWGGHGTEWPEPMIESGIWLMQGIVRRCSTLEENAFTKHSWIDPGRKADPGPLFVKLVEPRLRAACYPHTESEQL